jgi:hypothetical protein
MAGTILLVPLARVEDIARAVIVANTIVDRWGLVPRFYYSRWTKNLPSHIAPMVRAGRAQVCVTETRSFRPAAPQHTREGHAAPRGLAAPLELMVWASSEGGLPR